MFPEEFGEAPKGPEPEPPALAPVIPTPEPPAPVAEAAKTPVQRFVEIREQLAADYGKTFDQLTSGQKAAVTRKARAQAKLEEQAARGEAPYVNPEKAAPVVYKPGQEPRKPQEH